ncbi:squamosa promoter-binding -like (SBP domain) transcription factor family [Chlorella sorokiniana]|uniref:Squamosa promoter-binding-like (SBP domain) transcription factor family n=1 Tax=Chlorella sorokiniana TaxID=3076 RepID=A0A2P6TR16_CHLSO|nr:squamosa promoter-binding -like (SBP domain) transcription factor family [Chlorella sorokiniana]|eukprot:PRW56499.1 squamosa promoter-binding -like (SBP domain) transcription factor family [Chlorella sorokiniana]
MTAPHLAALLELGAAAWPGAYQSLPPAPLRPATGRGAAAQQQQQQPRCCQVCAINLEGTPIYFQRIRACKEHVSANAVPLNGQVQRFCQQCSRFHGVENFDGTQRSCRQQLARHAERRRLLRRARKGQPPAAGQQSRSRQQEPLDDDYPAKRQRSVRAPAPAPLAFPPLALPPLTLPCQPALAHTLPPLPPPLHSAGLQQLGLDRADSGGSSNSQLGLPLAASGGAPGAADPALAALAAAGPGAWPQPASQDASQLNALLMRLLGQQGPGAAPAPAAPAPLPAEQQLVSLLSALVEQQQAQQVQQRANAAAAILETLLHNQGGPLPAPSLQAAQLGSAFAPGGAAAAPAQPPAPAPARQQPAAAPAADQPLAALLAQLVGSLSK